MHLQFLTQFAEVVVADVVHVWVSFLISLVYTLLLVLMQMRCPANPIYYGGRPACSMRGPQHGGTSGPYGGKPEVRSTGSMLGSGGKLDARFVQDVTIFDGTELAPGTQFTKIWRLRNSGSIAWPPQTQLVHVGGDELGSVYAVTLEVICVKSS